jgi:hypothetical protein
VKAHRGKIHSYLGMVLDFSEQGVLQVQMKDYITTLLNKFPYEIGDNKKKYPWNQELFKVHETEKLIPKNEKEIFHKFVAKGLFLAKRARPDIMPSIAYLSTRVMKPTDGDWNKLINLLQFLKSTIEDVLHLSMDNTSVIKWYLDASYAVHKDMKSQTGAIMTLGQGAIQAISSKQKVNTRSSTEAELISFDDIASKVLWTTLFLEEQGYQVKENIVYRDNQSTMKLEINGKKSSGKRTRHFNIKYFFITDLIKRQEVKVEYCPTESMLADYMTKPLIGIKFEKFRKDIMNLKNAT